MEHQAVAETAVIGVPDGMRGEAVKAFVVLTPGRQPSRHVEFIEELPKKVSGKIRRMDLRDRPA